MTGKTVGVRYRHKDSRTQQVGPVSGDQDLLGPARCCGHARAFAAPMRLPFREPHFSISAQNVGAGKMRNCPGLIALTAWKLLPTVPTEILRLQ